jgi:hypothetical protein
LRFSFQINARRINDELNVFKDLHKSPIFIGVLIVTAGLQVGWLLSSGSCVVCIACVVLLGQPIGLLFSSSRSAVLQVPLTQTLR